MLQWEKEFMTNISIGLLILRIFIGLRLMYGVLDNLISWDHMQEFASFLGKYKFPFPMVSAIVSVAAQMIAGFLVMIGWQTKLSAAIIFINFLIAIFMVHFPNGDTIEMMTPALALLFVSASLFFTGAGKYSVDKV